MVTESAEHAAAPARSGPGRATTRLRTARPRPRWRAAISLSLYVLGAALILGGLSAGLLSSVFQGLELAIIGMLVADAWQLRQRTPLLRSANRRRAGLGWLIVVGLAVVVALLLPA